MNISIDTLSLSGSELTAEQLDDVDGGIVICTAMAVWAGIDLVIWGAIAVIDLLKDDQKTGN